MQWYYIDLDSDRDIIDFMSYVKILRTFLGSLFNPLRYYYKGSAAHTIT